MAKSGKAKGPPLEMALERGEKFFHKGNFPLAKRELETALNLGVSEALAREISDKLAVCAREIALLEGREAAKRARKLEKKGQYREALEQFEKALAVEHESWVEERIAALRLALRQAEASDHLQAVSRDEDPRVRLAAYDQALAAGADPAVSEQRANCLVELERFEEAIAQYASAPPTTDLARYRLGYAHAALGHYLDAFALWLDLETLPQGLAAQIEQLLPVACREAQDLPLDGNAAFGGQGSNTEAASSEENQPQNQPQNAQRARADGYGIISALAQRIDSSEKSATFAAWERQAACRRLDALWRQERFDEMPALLPPLGQPLDRAALALHAKVALKRAERDPEQLESAIGPWLTAVHDDVLLDTLAVHQVTPMPLDRHALRERLVQRLTNLVQDHAKNKRLGPRLKGIWRLEERVIRQLASLALDERALDARMQGEPPAGYPCTPGFAHRHGLAEGIFAFLEAQPHSLGEPTDGATQTRSQSPGSQSSNDASSPASASAAIDLLELRACFGPTGEAMMRMEAGEEEQALAAIPRGLDNELARYCRERIALACAIAKARRGEQRIKQHVLDALPLLQAEPKRVQELIDLVYADKASTFFEGLADALETLHTHIDHPALPEATAHCMGIKAVALLNRGANLDVAQKLLERALAIFPASELAGTTLDQLEERRLGEDINKAFKRNNPQRAARLVRGSSDPRNRDYFFKTIEHWYQAALGMKQPARTALLVELRDSCRIVDEDHPLMGQIAIALDESR